MEYEFLASELLENMWKLNHTLMHKQTKHLWNGNMFILGYLAMKEGFSLPSEISNEMNVSTARIAAALNNLENKSLIERRIDRNDRRRILVSITDEGEALVKDHRKCVQDYFIEILKKLGEDDSKEYIRIIKRIINISENE